MPCYMPMKIYVLERSRPGDEVRFTFDRKKAYVPNGQLLPPVQLVPCGECIGCRLCYARNWAVRIVSENKYHCDACFITLTYSDEFLPADRQLNYDHFTTFIQDTRNYMRASSGNLLRYLACGEYGSKTKRPHFHGILFSEGFRSDRVEYAHRRYTSPSLQALWPYGFVDVGNLTFQSAGYVARYVLKKAQPSYVAPEGVPEKIRMSRRPGLAQQFFEDYWQTIYPNDFIVSSDGRKYKPPRYFDKLLKVKDEQLYHDVKHKRLEALSRISEFDMLPSTLKMRYDLKHDAVRKRLLRVYDDMI